MVEPSVGRPREKVDGAEAQHMMRLGGVLAELVRRHQLKGAAAELGISYKTLQRARASGQMSTRLQEALETYLKDGPEQQQSPWWDRMESLESQMVELREATAGWKERLDRIAEEVREEMARLKSELEAGVRSLEKRVEEVRRLAERPFPGAGPPSSPAEWLPTAIDTLEAATPASSQPSPTSRSPGPAEVQEAEGTGEMVAKWTEAKGSWSAARTQLERAIASGALNQLEMDLIHYHGLSIPPGEWWDEVRRSREIDRRWYALEDARRARGRLALRRWVRRVLTVGLWWD